MDPMDVLNLSIGKKVTVIFKNGEKQEGILKCFDNYINITLEVDGSRELIIKGSKISLIVLQSALSNNRYL